MFLYIIRRFINSGVITKSMTEKNPNNMESIDPKILESLAKEGINPKFLEEVNIEYEEESASQEEVQLAKLYQEEQASVGKAFKNYLLKDLSNGLDDLASRLKDVPRLDSEFIEAVKEEPDYIAALPESEKVVSWALTPLDIFNAINSIEGLVKRAARRGMLPVGGPIYLIPNKGAKCDFGEEVAYSYFVEEVRRSTYGHSEEVSKILLEWIISVAKVKPYLFYNFRTKPHEDGIVLNGRKNNDDLFRWAVTEYPV